jgi:hypothetical protein
MSYWNGRSGSQSNLRLYGPNVGWLSYADALQDDGKTVKQAGSHAVLQSMFLNALSATNVVVLTGAGSSFCATSMVGDSAPGMGDLWDAVLGKVRPDEFAKILEIIPQKVEDRNIEKLLTLCKLYVELHGADANDAVAKIDSFINEAERAILKRVDFVYDFTDLTSHGMLLQKIARRGSRKPRAQIFTTNYDLCFEYAAQRHRFVVVDGFSHSIPQVYDRSHFAFDIVRRAPGTDAPDYIESVFRLYKLHGSLDWRRINGTIRRTREDLGDPVLIYPRSSKYQEAFDVPYLDMMGAFQSALREPDTALFICGFGFNDDHLSQPIMAAVEANMSLRLILCDPSLVCDARLKTGEHLLEERASSHIDNRFLEGFLRLINAGDPRISFINGRFEDLTAALPDLVAETERERHAARIRLLQENAFSGTST